MSDYTSAEHHPAFEEYCESIWGLEEDGVRVIQARLAERLRVTRPAVSEMTRRMADEGLVTISDGVIRLTRSGDKLATTMVRRHRLAECFLTDLLDLSWSVAHHEAGKWEHVISPEVEAAIVRKLGNPTTCPHGNPIPGTNYDAPDLVSLSTIETGQSVMITRIPEELEFASGLLEFLEENDIVPGVSARVLAKSPDGTATIEVGGRVVGISAFTTDRILVAQ